ncbi:MAG TPA: DUF2867 domain-containing protein [Solirubrobacteraceae bacterium]|jgi:hypothetical protein|nr:DUF2867 domain-containing protein [Solirubrobacteraceae bacterium]
MPNSLAGYDYDYDDSFTAPRAAADDRTPEQLARAVFEDAPRPVRWFLVSGFRYGLGLKFGPRPSPEHVLGWAIIDRSPDSVTIESRLWFLTSRLVFRTEPSRVMYSTYVRYDRRIAAIIWPPVSMLHRQIVPRMLRHAARRAQGPHPIA